MTNPRPELSKSELEIARLVWELGGGTVREVFDALPADREIDFKTVQTYLRRLESKGYLRTKLEGRTRVYSPAVEPDEVISETVDDFVHRLFGGETMPLVQHLIQDRGLSSEEIGQLRDLLEDLEEDEDA